MQINIKQSTLKHTLARILVTSLCMSIVACDTLNHIVKSDAKGIKDVPRATTAIEVPERIAAIDHHEKQIQEYMRQVHEAWATEDLAKLETIYNSLASYDAGNERAEEGLRMVGMARNHLLLLADAKKHIGLTEADDEIAKEKLHAILLERPNHPEAKPLYDNLLKKQEAKQQEKSHKKLAYKNPISLQFRDVNLKKLFEALAKITNINFILDKDVPSDQMATIYVQSMAFNDVLDLLLQTNQLEKKVLSENSAIIYVNDPLRQREYKDLTVRSFTLDYADAKQMSATLRSMLNIKQIEVDPRLNTLMIKDSVEVLALAEKLILSQDLPDPEVMLEMEVLEINRTKLQDLGVNIPTSLTVLASDSGKGLTLDDLKSISSTKLLVGGTLGATFNASNADVNLLANPRIRVKNKEVAKIHIGEKVPVFTSNISSTGVSSQTVQYIDAGLKLEVEPNISASGDVTIKINLNVSSIGALVTNGKDASQGSAFRVGTRTTTTQLRLHDGETQILAGLIDDQDRNNIDKAPGLGDIPLLGRLFSKKRYDKSKTEIVLSVTPHIVRERKTNNANQTEYWIGSEARTGMSSPTPNFMGGAPFFIPKPAAAPVPVSKEDKPQSLNVPLPPGFSLGGGLLPKGGE